MAVERRGICIFFLYVIPTVIAVGQDIVDGVKSPKGLIEVDDEEAAKA